MQVNNVIDPFKYTEVPFGSKSELKEYLKVSGRGLVVALPWSGSSLDGRSSMLFVGWWRPDEPQRNSQPRSTHSAVIWAGLRSECTC